MTSAIGFEAQQGETWLIEGRCWSCGNEDGRRRDGGCAGRRGFGRVGLGGYAEGRHVVSAHMDMDGHVGCNEAGWVRFGGLLAVVCF